MSRFWIDKRGYPREETEGSHSSLIHRKKAYSGIYLKNPDKYDKPFSEYDVHHKDRNKRNFNVNNLEILTRAEHSLRHGVGGLLEFLMIAAVVLSFAVFLITSIGKSSSVGYYIGIAFAIGLIFASFAGLAWFIRGTSVRAFMGTFVISLLLSAYSLGMGINSSNWDVLIVFAVSVALTIAVCRLFFSN